MEWKPITADEAKSLKYASRTGQENPYKGLFDAIEKGPVRIDVEPAKLQALKTALTRASKNSQVKIVVATLVEKNGVVVTKATSEQTKK